MPTTITKSRLCCICGTEPVVQKHDILQAYVCPECEKQKSYRAPNASRLGKRCKQPPFGLEFEIAGHPVANRRALVLLKYHYVRAYDSTVSDEYKSPVYQNLRAFRKPLAVLDSLSDLVTDTCGTHIHVSFTRKRELAQVRSIIFGPLIDQMQANREQTFAFWGRYFCPQARATLVVRDRHVCINTFSSQETLEFRLPRFRSAAQFVAAVKFCRETTALLEQHFYPTCEVQLGRPISHEDVGKIILERYVRALQRFERERTSQCADSL